MPNTNTARPEYATYCAEIGTTVEAEQTALLSIGREFLPPVALAVLDGAEPTDDFWSWCRSQTEAAQDEHDAEIRAGYEGTEDTADALEEIAAERRASLLVVP